mgnify:CR=1 FL=1
MNVQQDKKNSGVITLEACVCVLSFLILMLLLSSLFVMFMAQNATAHTVLQTSESLSIDSYSAEHIGTGGAGSVSEVVAGIGEFFSDLFGIAQDNPNYVDKDDLSTLSDAELASVIKTRFIGYLTGGNQTEADEMLERLNIVDGLDGLDFTDSYVDNDTLYIVLKYNLEYDFNIWNVGTVEVEQTTCSKLWK